MKNIFKALFFSNLLILFLLSSFISVYAENNGDDTTAIILTAEGPITPILAEYLDRGLELAEGQNAEVVILQLNTPGGSVDIMNTIVQKIRSSKTPVVVYVSPQNAMAGSAGTIITLAGHLSAMSPETTIGGGSSLGDVLVKDSEVDSVKTKNLIIVGGSCINSAAATVLGSGYCGPGFTTATSVGTGQFLIQSFADKFTTGKIALLVAGYEAADTVNAGTYLRTQTVDTTAGKKYIGTSQNSAELVVA